ncbi:MAG: transposase, partial [bacterium]
MARPLRIEFAGAFYHVTSRGIGRRNIFTADNDRTKFLQYLKENLERHRIQLYSYVLMNNHYHMI